MGLQTALLAFGRYVSGHRTQLYAFGALSGVAITTAIALKEGPEIKRIIDEKMLDLKLTQPEDKDTRRVIKTELVRKVGPRALKIIAAAAITMRFIVKLDAEHRADYASAAALAALNQRKLDEMELITGEVVGPKRLDEIKTRIQETKAREEPLYSEKDTYDGGGYAVYDPQSGFKFHIKDPADLKMAKAELQESLNDCVSWVNVNDFYSQCTDKFINIRYCDRWGWNIGQKIDINWTIGADPEGHPCYVLEYNPDLRRNLHGDLLQDDM